MVKGVSKRVVVVKPPQSELFEEAIFILKEDAVHRVGVNAEQVFKEACTVANNYVSQNCERKSKHLPPLCFVALGAGLTGLLWLVCSFLH